MISKRLSTPCGARYMQGSFPGISVRQTHLDTDLDLHRKRSRARTLCPPDSA